MYTADDAVTIFVIGGIEGADREFSVGAESELDSFHYGRDTVGGGRAHEVRADFSLNQVVCQGSTRGPLVPL